MNAVLDELTWRGLLAHSTDPEALASHLDEGQVTFYAGFDPSAPSLHFGNLVQLIVARKLQDAGHRPLILVGGGTGLIGDPKETGERVMNPVELVHEWAERIRAQVERYVTFSGPNAAHVVNNYDWLSGINVIDFLRDTGKHFPVNRMLARDVVARRLEAGISYTEFSYVLLQSTDYRELFRRQGATLQTGGSDQWGNITAGVELIRRSDGAKVHALATPLLTKADGTKFGKTAGGSVWLDPTMTSPYAFHQFFLNAEDEKVIDYLKVFSPRGKDEIDELAQLTAEQPYKRAAQRALADDITDLVHSVADRQAATAAADALFGKGDLAALSASTLDAVATEVGEQALESSQLPSVVDALVLAGVVDSKAAAKRAINEGGAQVNGVKVTDPEALLSPADVLPGGHILLKRGKKTMGFLSVPPA